MEGKIVVHDVGGGGGGEGGGLFTELYRETE